MGINKVSLGIYVTFIGIIDMKDYDCIKYPIFTYSR